MHNLFGDCSDSLLGMLLGIWGKGEEDSYGNVIGNCYWELLLGIWGNGEEDSYESRRTRFTDCHVDEDQVLSRLAVGTIVEPSSKVTGMVPCTKVTG